MGMEFSIDVFLQGTQIMGVDLVILPMLGPLQSLHTSTQLSNGLRVQSNLSHRRHESKGYRGYG